LGQAELGYNAVTVDVAAASAAIAPLAKALGGDVLSTAEAIINVSVSGMYSGVSRIVSRFGIDPRTFALLPFGGAGPMLACHLARALNMREVVVPTTPGVLSALGGLIADTRNDFVKTTYYDVSASNIKRLADDLEALQVQAREWIINETGSAENSKVQVSADMRYKGQSFELDTPVNIEALQRGDVAGFNAAFHNEHTRVYGHCDVDAAVQVVSTATHS
jgi:N-methylhydantoinase A